MSDSPLTHARQNTDRELWRESETTYADSIHVTVGGGIGINCGGDVIVLPLRRWHEAAAALLADTRAAQSNTEADDAYGYLSRVLVSVRPQVIPSSTLMHVCTQIDNLIAGLLREADTRAATEGTSGWRDIESAPKDKTHVDLWVYWPHGGPKRVTDCWQGSDGVWMEWAYAKDGRYPWPVGGQAHYWMPIPSAPLASQEVAPPATRSESAPAQATSGWREIATAPESERVIVDVPNAGVKIALKTTHPSDGEVWWDGQQIIVRPSGWQPIPRSSHFPLPPVVQTRPED